MSTRPRRAGPCHADKTSPPAYHDRGPEVRGPVGQRYRSGCEEGFSPQRSLRAPSNTRDEPLGKEEGHRACQGARHRGHDCAEEFANRALHEPPSEGSNEHCEQSRHPLVDRRLATHPLGWPALAARISRDPRILFHPGKRDCRSGAGEGPRVATRATHGSADSQSKCNTASKKEVTRNTSLFHKRPSMGKSR